MHGIEEGNLEKYIIASHTKLHVHMHTHISQDDLSWQIIH